MIKIIATDLDGTLLTDEKKLPPDFFEVLEKLKEKGITFVAASGRSHYTIEKIFVPHENDVVFISDNGAYMIGKDFESINFPMSKKQADDVVEKCLQIGGLNPIMCAKTKAYFVRPIPECVEIINEYYINYEIVDDYQDVQEEILKIAVYDPEGSGVHGYPMIKDHLDSELIGVVSADNWFDVMNKNVNKGFALRELQKLLGVSFEETMAFGDFNNDIEMLKEAKYSFAMANSNDDVKRAAKYGTADNNDFGVTKAIKEYVLD